MQTETGDEDKPEIEPDPQLHIELEGLFICFVFVCFASPLEIDTMTLCGAVG